MKTLVLALALSTAALASEPVPTQPPTKGLLGRSAPVTATRSLADVARQKASGKGTISQMDGAPTEYRQPQLLGLTGAPIPAASNVTFNAPASVGTTHGAPVVGMSIEEHRERAAAAAATPQPAR